MAALVLLGLVTIATGAFLGAFLFLSFAMRRDDRRGSLWFDAPTHGAQTARNLVGISSSRRD